MMTERAVGVEMRRVLAGSAERLGRPVALMEVCGTHTMAIRRHGLLSLFPASVRLISGPGCPVCVTSQGQVDQIVELALRPGVTIATFGDMIRVPGAESSLEKERARGADVRVVYSPLDAVHLAAALPARQVVFVGIGFETTAPTVAGALREARRRGLENFTVFAAGKRVVPALEALLASGQIRIDGLICPGHVSVIIGSEAYRRLAESFDIPCVVAGFEPEQVVEACEALLLQLAEGRAEVENRYPVWVRPQGNRKALETIDSVFEPGPARWRGLGTIDRSGLLLRNEWSDFDAAKRHRLEDRETPEPDGCRCGEVLRGALAPPQCPLFGRFCTPESPIGPCMVSSEGSCAAAYRYS